MQKLIISILVIILLSPIGGYARGIYKKAPSYRPHGQIHSVRPYMNKRGGYYKSHLSANPHSGLQCRNNICRAKNR